MECVQCSERVRAPLRRSQSCITHDHALAYRLASAHRTAPHRRSHANAAAATTATPFAPVMSRATWMKLLDLQKTSNVFTDGAKHLCDDASPTTEAAEAAVLEFCTRYSELEAHFQSVPREDGTCGGGSPAALAQPAGAQAAEPAAAAPQAAPQAAVAPTYYVLIDGYGQQVSLHATRKDALKRSKTYDGFSILALQVGGEDKCTDITDSEPEEEDEEPAPKKKRARVEEREDA